MNKQYSIICICQIYNEIEKGNLKRFFEYTKQIVDAIVIYDDGSTDGSYEYALKHTKYVIRNSQNNFEDEGNHKNIMLEKALKMNPNFILWLDADEILTINAEEQLQKICQQCIDKNMDGISLHEINLWRSKTWHRIDSLYNEGWFVRLWRVTPYLNFGKTELGLHKRLYPHSIKKIIKNYEIEIIHYGFASKKSLAYKYLIYKKHGQRGYNMLDRLISEEKLELKRISQNFFPKALWEENEIKPQKMNFLNSLSYVEKYKEKVFRPKYSIACLIYKSVDWLKFVYEQILKYTNLNDKEFYFIANDACPEVINYLQNNYIPYYIFNNTDKQKQEWYINNVYRAYNYAAKVAKGDFIVFINSDMAFSPNWFENLISNYNGYNCIASRLIESGKLSAGNYGIEKNFGKNISSYKEAEFQQYAQLISEKSIKNNGLFMPLLIKKEHFENVGGYPEGNIKLNSNIFNPQIAEKGETNIISGDNVLIQKLKTININHQTSFNSMVYHFQCGERDEKKVNNIQNQNTKIAICNDLTTGTMGEKVLWDYLIENLQGAYGVDKKIVKEEKNFEQKAREYINKNHVDTKIIIQNASFIKTIDSSRYAIMFLQDDLRSMGKTSIHQEANLKIANKIVVNSMQTALAYSDYDCEIIPIGIDHSLFKPMDKNKIKTKHKFGDEKIGIFVGSFTETKGWSKIKECINTYPQITWILISKHKNDYYEAKNVRVYNRITQKLLSELLNCADFFIIGSPIETQCLAALEACFCNVPLVMPNIGIFKEFSENEKSKLGVFGDNLKLGIDKILKNKFYPRDLILTKGLTIQDSLKKWHRLLQNVILDINIQTLNNKKSFSKNNNLYWKYKLEIYIRKKILKKIIGRENLDITNSTYTLIYTLLKKLKLINIVKKIRKIIQKILLKITKD
ncbi:MAG: glycosyltransferase [bacterium]|nr:glycosyltransferase [bacterium]